MEEDTLEKDYNLTEGQQLGDKCSFLYKEHWIKIVRVYGNNFNLIKEDKRLTDNFDEVNCVVCGKNVNESGCLPSDY